MESLTPYVSFTGKCREAMNFYQSIFGGELELNEVEGSPMEQYWPDGKGQLFHSALTLNGKPLIMATDMTGPAGQTVGNNIQLAIGCGSEDEIHRLANQLAEGGQVLAPVADTFWNALFGSVQDKFGINWMLNYDKE